jgi:hypothetical protein
VASKERSMNGNVKISGAAADVKRAAQFIQQGKLYQGEMQPRSNNDGKDAVIGGQPADDPCADVCNVGGYCQPPNRDPRAPRVNVPMVIAHGDCVNIEAVAGVKNVLLHREQLRNWLGDATRSGRQAPIFNTTTIAAGVFNGALAAPAASLLETPGFYVEISASDLVNLATMGITIQGTTPNGEAYTSGQINLNLQRYGKAGVFVLAATPIAANAQEFYPTMIELEDQANAFLTVGANAWGAGVPAAATAVPKTDGGVGVTFAGNGPDGMTVQVRSLAPADDIWDALYARL